MAAPAVVKGVLIRGSATTALLVVLRSDLRRAMKQLPCLLRGPRAQSRTGMLERVRRLCRASAVVSALRCGDRRATAAAESRRRDLRARARDPVPAVRYAAARLRRPHHPRWRADARPPPEWPCGTRGTKRPARRFG